MCISTVLHNSLYKVYTQVWSCVGLCSLIKPSHDHFCDYLSVCLSGAGFPCYHFITESLVMVTNGIKSKHISAHLLYMLYLDRLYIDCGACFTVILHC